MDRLTFDGNFCDIAMCRETPGGSFCEDGYCSQRKVWERLKQYEDTGISPELIIDLLSDDMTQAATTIRNMIDNGEFEIIQHLAGCYNDGRLVVLPCRDDAEFLAALRHELLTQPTDGNRDPRFWGVKDEVIEWGYDEEWAEGWGVYDSENCCKVGENNDLQSVISELTEPDGYAFRQEDFADCTEPEEVVERANELGGGFSLNYYRIQHLVSEDHLFLTKKACQEYIDRYGYNHNKPHTYVMTADRCPEYARLLKIMKETEWNGGAE